MLEPAKQAEADARLAVSEFMNRLSAAPASSQSSTTALLANLKLQLLLMPQMPAVLTS